jgi:hypothetical protein
MIQNIIAGFIVILITCVESSLQTAVIFDRSAAWWTVWLYKIGPLSVADEMIITVALYVGWKLLKNNFQVNRSPYMKLCLFAFSYLLIGLLYNIFIFTNWKYFLYDFKALLYLTVPYLFLYFTDIKVKKILSYRNIFILYAVGQIIDFGIVSLFGQADRPSFLGLSLPTTLLPFSVSLVGLLYTKDRAYKIWYSLLIMIELVVAINLIALSSLVNSMSIIIYMSIAKASFKKIGRYVAVLSIILLVNLLSIWSITNPFGNELLAAKSDGAVTRQIQLANALLNSTENIPGLIGKGLGSTWFEYIPIPQTDIFSIGTSGGEIDEALASPVKFIFNWIPPVLIHKWGILGTLFLIYFISMYLHSALKSNKINHQLGKISVGEKQGENILLMTSFIFIVENFTYIGLLRTSLITSLLAFYVENRNNNAIASKS